MLIYRRESRATGKGISTEELSERLQPSLLSHARYFYLCRIFSPEELAAKPLKQKRSV